MCGGGGGDRSASVVEEKVRSVRGSCQDDLAREDVRLKREEGMTDGQTWGGVMTGEACWECVTSADDPTWVYRSFRSFWIPQRVSALFLSWATSCERELS